VLAWSSNNDVLVNDDCQGKDQYYFRYIRKLSLSVISPSTILTSKACHFTVPLHFLAPSPRMRIMYSQILPIDWGGLLFTSYLIALPSTAEPSGRPTGWIPFRKVRCERPRKSASIHPISPQLLFYLVAYSSGIGEVHGHVGTSVRSYRWCQSSLVH